jgi:hypothetical protein
MSVRFALPLTGVPPVQLPALFIELVIAAPVQVCVTATALRAEINGAATHITTANLR